MNIFYSIRNKAKLLASASPVSIPATQVALHRVFVETGEERCPLAGIWSRLTDVDPVADEPEIRWPAVSKLILAAGL
jgi:hypothetical protein